MTMAVCGKKCEIYSRVCGYHRPVEYWNSGKKAEYADRKEFTLDAIRDKPKNG